MPCVMKFLFLIILSTQLTSCSTLIYRELNSFQRWRAGAREEIVRAGDYDFSIADRAGDGETILLVHGFGASKDGWNEMLRKFDKSFRIVAPDLPGWGNTPFRPSDSYRPEDQAKRLEDLRKALQLGRVHVVGISMGGAIAGTYAGLYPENIATLTLIDAAGVVSPQPSDYARELQAGRNPLILREVEDVDKLFPFVFYKPPYLPWIAKKIFYDQAAPRVATNERLFSDLIASGPVLEKYLTKTKAPLQVIWGQNDRIIDISSVKVIQQLRPDARVEIIPECGHAPIVEKAEETTQLVTKFILEQSGNRAKDPL